MTNTSDQATANHATGEAMNLIFLPALVEHIKMNCPPLMQQKLPYGIPCLKQNMTSPRDTKVLWDVIFGNQGERVLIPGQAVASSAADIPTEQPLGCYSEAAMKEHQIQTLGRGPGRQELLIGSDI